MPQGKSYYTVWDAPLPALCVLVTPGTCNCCIFSSLVTGGVPVLASKSLLLVLTEYRNNFNKQSLENTTYNFQYDYDSIMHYGQYFFRSVLLSLWTGQVQIFTACPAQEFYTLHVM
jgi:hypothetical protein